MEVIRQIGRRVRSGAIVALSLAGLAGAAHAQFSYTSQSREVSATASGFANTLVWLSPCGGEPFSCGGAPIPTPASSGENKSDAATSAPGDFSLFEHSVAADVRYVKPDGGIASGHADVAYRSELLPGAITTRTLVHNSFSGNVLGDWTQWARYDVGVGSAVVSFDISQTTDVLISASKSATLDLSNASGQDVRGYQKAASLYETMSVRLASGNGDEILRIMDNGTQRMTLAAGHYTLYTFGEFGVQDPAGSGSMSWLAETSLQVVPEPSTWMLMGLGLLAVSFVSRIGRLNALGRKMAH
jgi:hypothetical protein